MGLLPTQFSLLPLILIIHLLQMRLKIQTPIEKLTPAVNVCQINMSRSLIKQESISSEKVLILL